VAKWDEIVRYLGLERENPADFAFNGVRFWYAGVVRRACVLVRWSSAYSLERDLPCK